MTGRQKGGRLAGLALIYFRITGPIGLILPAELACLQATQ